MPRFTQDQPFDSELNKNTKESLRQNLLSNIENVNPVDGVLLPGGGVGIIKSENIIIPIKRDYDYAGTLNQDGFVAINISSNTDKCLVVVDGQPSYRSTPTKFVFSISDILGVGTKTIAVTKEGHISNEQYNISIVQNPNFTDNTFDNYRNKITNYDGALGLEPERKIFTQTTPYVFRIEKFVNGELISTDASTSPNDIKELVFDLKKQNPKDDALIKVPETSTYNVTINLKGPNNSVNLTNVNTSENIKLTNEVTTLIVEVGTKLQIVSVNNNLYKISRITATSQGLKPRVLEALNTDTLFSEYNVENNTVIDIESENITIVQPASNPVIKLLSPDETRKYNRNSQEDYPIILVTQNINQIVAYVKDKTFNFDVNPVLNSAIGVLTGNVTETPPTVISIPKTAFDSLGNYKIYLVGKNGDVEQAPIELKLSVIDEFFVGVPDIQSITYPKELIGGDYVGTDVDFEISYTSRDTDFVKIFVNNSAGFYQEGPNARITLNVKKLLEFSSYTGPNDVIKLNLKLVPYNISGTKQVVGKEELITVTFRGGDLTIPRQLVINRIAAAFTTQFDESIFGDESSKYLNHLLHLGDGESKVVTTWTGSFDSLILKLYEPLPVTVQPNQLVWISKVQSTPIIETISLRGETETACNTLKGPNFSLNPDNGIEFQIYDDLVGSGSVASVDVINRYASTVGIDTQKLNIEYISGSEYVFSNFINFSSATERVDNFIYKVRLVEYYKNIYFTNTSTASASPYELNEANTSLNKANQLVNAMDGFEKYLYYTTNTNSNNLAYPKTNSTSSILVNTTSSLVTMWYDELLSQAEYFDKYNPNRLSANIPEFLVEDTSNEDFITFLNMIGQHFDILWSYISSLAKTKSVEASEYKGISNDVVQFVLESHGWDVKKAFNSNFLWEYAFGTYKDGTPKYSKSLESANEEIWRRILNNLPYILKHKGTGRAMKAVMACYGVPQSMLTIMEFGGPQDPTKGGSTKFTFDDRTAAIYLSGSASVKVPWKFFTGSLDYPNCVEFRFKPDSLPNTTSTLISGSEWTLDLVQTTGSFGKLELNFGGDQALTTYMETPFISASVSTTYFDTSIEYVFGPDYKTGSLDFPISTEYYSNVAINRYNSAGTGSWYEVWLGTSNGDRIITSVSMSIFAPDTQWSSGSHLQIGSNTFTGNVDEVRLWRVPLQRSKFNNHVLFPDATNGNSYTASTEDLLFRLDFEYPKDRNADPYIKNVAINQSYDGTNSYATASQMYTATTYPYQYTPYDRTVTAEVPSLGFGYSNKIRFESASLVTDLSYKTRATKKAFDQAPIDSNRLGLFFSPIKELNMDILKTFGDFNIDNYIGDPRDEYKDTYSELETLREYYFERMNQNINEYIQLVRYIDKSLFDVLAELAPARAKVSKGLLIEPHLLERSKTKWKETIAEKNSYDTTITTNDDVILESDFIPKEAELNAINNTVLLVEKTDYDGALDAATVYDLDVNPAFYDTSIDYLQDAIISGSVPMYDFSLQIPNGSTLSGEVDSFKFEAIGMERDSLANVGFGLYARNGNAIVSGFDGLFGNYYVTHITASVNGGDRKSVFLVKEQYNTKVSTQTQGWPATNIPGQTVKYEDVVVTNFKYKVSTLPFSGSVAVGGTINEVTAINGYLPTHYRYVNGLGEGMRRSFWKGSQQTATTTPDGLSPVETFTTNPNILKVANTGRGSGEPILIVD